MTSIEVDTEEFEQKRLAVGEALSEPRDVTSPKGSAMSRATARAEPRPTLRGALPFAAPYRSVASARSIRRFSSSDSGSAKAKSRALFDIFFQVFCKMPIILAGSVLATRSES